MASVCVSLTLACLLFIGNGADVRIQRPLIENIAQGGHQTLIQAKSSPLLPDPTKIEDAENKHKKYDQNKHEDEKYIDEVMEQSNPMDSASMAENIAKVASQRVWPLIFSAPFLYKAAIGALAIGAIGALHDAGHHTTHVDHHNHH